MKKRLLYGLAFSLLCIPIPASAINLTIDGTPIKTDAPPVVLEGRTLVPLRAIFEALGANVEWDNATKTATAIKAGTEIKLTLNNKTASVNGIAQTLDVPAQSIDGRTMVPARFIADNLGYTVGWNSNTNTVTLTSYNNAYDHLDAGAKNVPGVPDGWFPYHGGNYSHTLNAILEGNVVYVNGQYWCSPDYANLIGNETIVYSEDISTNNAPIYDNLKPDSVVIPLETDWVSIDVLDDAVNKIAIQKILSGQTASASVSYFDVLKHYIPSLPSSFASNPTSGEYEGLKIKVENGKIFLCKSDLLKKGIL